MNRIILILSLSAIIFYGCNNNNPVNNNTGTPSDYVKIYTASSGNAKFEVYSLSSTNFVYGYNDLGFKVYLNNVEQNQGFVKFKPTMYHGIGGPFHSVPVSDKFYFNSDKSLFTGYSIFIMYDTAAFWSADFNYNDAEQIDSMIIPLIYSSNTKIAAWDNTITQKTYFLTMLSPSDPRVGLNDVDLMLHQTQDMVSYTEVNDAEMFIRPWMESMGHGSSNNVNPAMISTGRYKGTANFNMPGEWFLYDSIKVSGNFITNTPAPKFILQVN
ncbi:MAG: FixH family protein [Ignavibacteria bacterium]|nr:FixH family protein [Ignavibacteria bacterium]